MLKKSFLLVIVVALALPLMVPSVGAQDEKPKIGFLPGVVDPFYQVMELGVNQAAADFGLEVVAQYPEDCARRGHQDHHGRHLPGRWRLRQRPHHVPDLLHRL
jgi:hypothetical protein